MIRFMISLRFPRKACATLALILLLLCPGIFGQSQSTLSPDRHIPALTSVDQLRRPNETRVWSFNVKKTEIGRLLSRVEEIDPGNSVTIESNLDLDYSKVDQNRRLVVSSKTTYSASGVYLEDHISIAADSNHGELSWTRDGGLLTLVTTANDSRLRDTLSVDSSVRVWEPYFLDQLELFLAMRPLRVGDSIIDSVFQPQGRTVTQVRGDVPYFMWQEIWKGKIDSVFIIRLSAPMNAQLYYTADRRLVRVDYPDENIRAYQDAIIRSQTPVNQSLWATVVDKFARIQFVSLVLAAFFFVPLCVIGLFLSRRGTNHPERLVRAGLYGIGAGLLYAIVQPVISTALITMVKTSGILLTSLLSSITVAVLTMGLLWVVLTMLQAPLSRTESGSRSVGWGEGFLAGLFFGATTALITLGQGRVSLFSAGMVEQLLLTILLAVYAGGLVVMSSRSARSTIIWIGIALATLVLWRVLPSSMMTTGVNPVAIVAIYLILSALWVGVVFLIGLFPMTKAHGRKRK